MGVVVTGWGAVTPLGGNAADSWQAVAAGRDAAAPVPPALFDVSGCRATQAASALLPDLPDIPPRALRRLSRASRLALPAAREALEMAGLLDRSHCRSVLPELALSASTTGGGMAFGEEFLRRRLKKQRGGADVLRYLPQQQVADLQQFLGLGGPAYIIANACASGANALGHGADLILSGEAGCVLAGGFEALTELIFDGFDSLQATTTEKCRPFDINRTGLLLGEGAAFFVLESEEHAAARGAAPLCRLAGYGHTTDFFHLTQPNPEGKALAEAMARACARAGISPSQIGYVNAHGTATPLNDGAEAAAYRAFFGRDMEKTRVSSTKAAVGHTLGAAGAIEALFAIQALRTGVLPPQLNVETPLPEIAAVLARPGETRSLSHVLSVNLGFGGSNAALLFSRA